ISHFLAYNIQSSFKHFAGPGIFPESYKITNPRYISIGKNFRCLANLRLEAIDYYAKQNFTPSIIIGDNVFFNSDCHIAAISEVIIGDNVLLASRVFISDHFHGNINESDLAYIPINRPLSSKGAVIIENDVWIGEGVCILPGVTVGKFSIIGANSVVTQNVLPYSVVGGVPAKLIKVLK
ncbi:MAG: acyltransferase, partial [Flavobacterium sp.]